MAEGTTGRGANINNYSQRIVEASRELVPETERGAEVNEKKRRVAVETGEGMGEEDREAPADINAFALCSAFLCAHRLALAPRLAF